MQVLTQTTQSVYLLGGRPGVPEAVAQWMEENHPGIQIAGCHHGYYAAEEEAEVIAEIARSGADILLVAFGAPKQDKWISEHQEALGVPVAIGVGGLFDFYSGRISRAPQWIREMGMEWLYRLLMEPARLWKRYVIGNGLFLMRVFWRQFHEKKAVQPDYLSISHHKAA